MSKIRVNVIEGFPAPKQRTLIILLAWSMRCIFVNTCGPIAKSDLALLLREISKRAAATAFAKVIFESARSTLEDVVYNTG